MATKPSCAVGLVVGEDVEPSVGSAVGRTVGEDEGADVGETVGAVVGLAWDCILIVYSLHYGGAHYCIPVCADRFSL